jgi:putative hydrolase of the HAD superfamily
MSLKLLIFDLDETLAPDDELNRMIFDELTADMIAAHNLHAGTWVTAFEETIDDLWERGPASAYCLRIGISAWEGLWGPFGASEHPMLAALHAFVPNYRERAWSEALASIGVEDSALPRVCAEWFLRERRARQAAYPWSRGVLTPLATEYRLAMITNGAPDLQRLKLAGTGLADLFEQIVVSGELDIGKPDVGIFAHVLAHSGVEPGEALMVGDSWQRDMLGAYHVGLRAVWINPRAVPMPALIPATLPGEFGPQTGRVHMVRDLRDLPALLAGTASID